MDLFAPLKQALRDTGYETPTPIQAQTIPPAIAGQDILGCAQTGTGKTAAFALPILDFIGQDKVPAQSCRPAALVLAPTRELAIQIGDSFLTYGKRMKFRQALVYGGVGQGKQVDTLRKGVQLLVATPGRLIDLMDQGYVDLSDVEIFVLDEADRMLDMGFAPALKKIIAKLPKERQSLFFSATMPPKVAELAGSLLFNPVCVDVTPESTSVERIRQLIRRVDRGDKSNALKTLLNHTTVGQAIVFTRTKRGANGVAQKLDRDGIRAVAIHGNKTQNARQRALEAFRSGQASVLVATDVAARGLDIDDVSHVINYDMPVEPESYVHRIGRTGRAGADGIAVSFCTAEEQDELRQIEKWIGQQIEVENPQFRFAAVQPGSKNPRSSGRDSGRRSGGGGRKSRFSRSESGDRSGRRGGSPGRQPAVAGKRGGRSR